MGHRCECINHPMWVFNVLSSMRALYNDCLLDHAHRDRIDVVLASPRNPLNIGAAARAMANFGFTQLTVVAPYEAHWREARSAVGAPDLLRGAKESTTLADALAECTLAIGTGTLTARRPEQSVVALPNLAPLVERELQRGGRVAIVFGSEKRGLTREDLSRCHLLTEIPTDPRQPSMNLGQAVAICLYEMAARLCRDEHLSTEAQAGEPAAQGAEVEMLADAIAETMESAHYSPRAMGGANRHDVQVLLRRLTLTSRDARRALGFFRRILWRLKQ
jgi:TrmH family RNA methyltransferase